MNVLRCAVVHPGTADDGCPCRILRLRGDLEKTLRLLPRNVSTAGSGGRFPWPGPDSGGFRPWPGR
jgi:hypothetical protein